MTRLYIAGGVALSLIAWTFYQRHDAVVDYKRAIEAKNAAARAVEQTTRQENADAARDLDNDALRDAIPQRRVHTD